ncbi:MAG: rRNA maturation RNase YbeY [Planctomycetota bacterium]
MELVDRFRPRTARALVERVVDATLAFASRPDWEVSLLLTDDEEIARLHGEFLGDPTPTDVMSFEMEGGAEVVVSVETARRTAQANGTSIRGEVALYIVHGLLHTLGYDDKQDVERRRMRAAERVVLEQLRLEVRDVDA